MIKTNKTSLKGDSFINSHSVIQIGKHLKPNSGGTPMEKDLMSILSCSKWLTQLGGGGRI